MWLSDMVKESILSEYPVTVIHNGIDTSVFKPTKSEIRNKLGLKGKKIVLGVAALWEPRKGLNDFYRLSKMLSDKFCIILVGLSKNQIARLPKKIIGIERTNSAEELAELYSEADVYVNPTYEDNYPTTNLEAIACKTPVVTYDTGGSAESAALFGGVVKKGDIDGLYKSVMLMVDSNPVNVKISGLDVSHTIDDYMQFYAISELNEKCKRTV